MYPSYPDQSIENVNTKKPIAFPPQNQTAQPGIESQMQPKPIFDNPDYKGSGKLKGKVALITGGDSGIGRAAAIAYAKEGADLAIVYLNEKTDALETKAYIEKLNQKCVILEGNITDVTFCTDAIAQAMKQYHHLDILVNNAAVQYPQTSILDITDEQLELTFRTNIFAMFYLTKAALPYLSEWSAIINTASVTAYKGEKTLLDYSATKGAIVSFTRSLAENLIEQNIRVNAVAPGPIWTPLIVSSFPPDRVKAFGTTVPIKRAAQPFEVAPAYVYLASDDSRYVTGQVLHVNGGTAVES